MTGLLVSVRSAAEAQIAVAGGATIVDVKEPTRGSLGAADAAIWRQIQAVVGDQAITSAALGELLEEGIEQRAAAAGGFRYAKIGLAGCVRDECWRKRWLAGVQAVPTGVCVVPVAYADWPGAGAPDPMVVMKLAANSAGGLMLIDTHDKSRGGLLNHLSLTELHLLAAAAQAHGVSLALAGSLTPANIQELLKLSPAYIGVRGAACSGGRNGQLDLARVKSLAGLVAARTELAAS
jgi:uncharacterized protein (UPF0264 family)